MRKRILLASALIGALVCALAGPAAAHVTTDPASAPRGGTVKLSFLVPNEETSKVTELAIGFPAPPQTPIPTVSVEAKPGWTIQVTTLKLTKPLVTADGTINEVVSRIDWKAKTGADAIDKGQFGEFTIDADGLPDTGNEVVFKAIQTYANGDVVRWIDPVTPGGPDAVHPTPILELTNPAGGATTGTSTPASGGGVGTALAASTKDNSARALGIIAVVLGAVALLFATGALMRKRRA